MDQKDTKPGMARRDFLKVASVGAAAGAAMVASGEATAAVAVEDQTSDGDYAETGHVAKYYELANI